MTGFIQGENRSQATLFPERLDDYVPEESAVRVIDVFIDELDLSGIGFSPQDIATLATLAGNHSSTTAPQRISK